MEKRGLPYDSEAEKNFATLDLDLINDLGAVAEAV